MRKTRYTSGLGGIEEVALKDLLPGPVLHTLTSEQRDQVGRIQKVFEEVFPCTLEQALDNFSRDEHPDAEIALWMQAADIYERFVGSFPTLEARKALFRSIVTTGRKPVGG